MKPASHQGPGASHLSSSWFGAVDDLSTTDATGPRAAMDRDGNAAVTWYGYDGSTYRVYAAYRPNAGSFGATQNLTPTGNGWATASHIAMAPGGRATVVWQRYAGGVDGTSGTTTVQSAESNSSGNFGTTQTLPTPAGLYAQRPDVAVDSQNTAVATWYTYDPAGPTYVGQGAARNSGGFFGTPQPLSGPGSSAFSPDIEMDGAGNALVVWASSDSIQAARRPAGGTFGGPQTISSAPINARPPALDFDDQGNALIGWTRYTNPDPPFGAHTQQALGYDAAGPELRSLNTPTAGTKGEPLSFSVAPFDRWSSFVTSWDFGDDSSASGNSVQHAYPSAGAYTVRVTSTDAVGNSTTITRTVQISDPPPTGGGRGAATTPPPPQSGPPTVISSTVTNKWSLFASYTKLRALAVNNVPPGATVKVTCRTKNKRLQRKRCPYKIRSVTTTFARAKLDLAKPFKKRKLPVKAAITITITAPGSIGKAVKFTIRKRALPTSTVLCLQPGAKTPGKCV